MERRRKKQRLETRQQNRGSILGKRTYQQFGSSTELGSGPRSVSQCVVFLYPPSNIQIYGSKFYNPPPMSDEVRNIYT